MNIKIKSPQSNGRVSFVKYAAIFLFTATASIFGLAIFVPGPLQKNAYVGAEKCGSCHQAEYKSWMASGHSKAWVHLPQENKTDQACLSCHATGVLQKGDRALPGVQCESCHGPGQHYMSLHIKKDPVLSKLLFMQKPNEETCKQCHSLAAGLWTPKHGMKKIEHWSKDSLLFHQVSGVAKQ